MRVEEFRGLKLYKALPKNKQTKKDGTPRDPHKLGRLHSAVFSPDGRRVVGFMLSLPDIAGMIKQDDRFVAFDSFKVYQDVITVQDSRESYDETAAKRLGVDLDSCIIWTGMDVVTESGQNVGYCADADFSLKTGLVSTFILNEGGASNALVGHREVPVKDLVGYRDGAMVVRNEVADFEFSGGAAAKAAEATVKVKAGVKKGAAALDEHGSRALDKGSKALGRQLGKTKGMFGNFAAEFKKAAGLPDKPAKKKAK